MVGVGCLFVVFVGLFYVTTNHIAALGLVVLMGLGDALNYSSLWPLIPFVGMI